MDLGCLAVGFLDVVLVFAVLFRGGPLRERGTGAVVGDTWDALALSLATFFHLGTDLDPGDSGMRLLIAVEGLLGAAALAGACGGPVLTVGRPPPRLLTRAQPRPSIGADVGRRLDESLFDCPHGTRVNAPSGPPSLSVAPANGTTIEIAPGLLWLRLALPFRLNHVNVYLVDDGDGWLLGDTGPGNAETEAIWMSLLAGGPDLPLGGRPITRILATHHHPDHLGAAAFLAEQTGAPLLMGETEYLTALNLLTGDQAENEAVRTSFYRRNGVKAEMLATTGGHLARYRSLVPALPSTFQPLRDGDRLTVGGRSYAVLDMPGHSPGQMILHDEADNRLLVADQVMTRISPNVGVIDRSPEDDPLQRFLASLERLRRLVPDGGLVLPGHHLPFRTLHGRIAELEAHHEVAVRRHRGGLHHGEGADRGRTRAGAVPVRTGRAPVLVRLHRSVGPSQSPREARPHGSARTCTGAADGERGPAVSRQLKAGRASQRAAAGWLQTCCTTLSRAGLSVQDEIPLAMRSRLR